MLHVLVDAVAVGVALVFVLYVAGDSLRLWWRRRSIDLLSQKGIVHADPARVHREAMAVADRLPGVFPPEPWPTPAGLATGPRAVPRSRSTTARVGKVNGQRPDVWLVD